jgi:hypothetical protein
MNIYVFAHINTKVTVTITESSEDTARTILATHVYDQSFYRLENSIPKL